MATPASADVVPAGREAVAGPGESDVTGHSERADALDDAAASDDELPGRWPLTDEFSRILDHARVLAAGLGHRELRLEHVVIAMTVLYSDAELRKRGFDGAKVRRACQRALADCELATTAFGTVELPPAERVERLLRSASRRASRRTDSKLRYIGVTDIVEVQEFDDFLALLSNRYAIRITDDDDAFDKTVARLKASLSEQGGRLTSLDSRIGIVDMSIGTVRRKVEELEGRLDEVRDQGQRQAEAMKSVSWTVDAIASRSTRMESAIHRLSGKLEMLLDKSRGPFGVPASPTRAPVAPVAQAEAPAAPPEAPAGPTEAAPDDDPSRRAGWPFRKRTA